MEQKQMDLIDHDACEAVSGGSVSAEDVHCPKCRSSDIEVADPGDIGTLPTYRCRTCGYEWMRPL